MWSLLKGLAVVAGLLVFGAVLWLTAAWVFGLCYSAWA